jgi:hypothetical protein
MGQPPTQISWPSPKSTTTKTVRKCSRKIDRGLIFPPKTFNNNNDSKQADVAKNGVCTLEVEFFFNKQSASGET